VRAHTSPARPSAIYPYGTRNIDVAAVLGRAQRSAAIANASCDQGGQDAAPFLAEDLFERRYQYTSEGRISTAPP